MLFATFVNEILYVIIARLSSVYILLPLVVVA